MINLTTREAVAMGILKGPAAKPARDDGFRSKWEADFSRHLECLKAEGAILEWGYERIKLRIGKRSNRAKMRAPVFTPDFYVIDANGRLKFYEVKGFYREGAKVRSAVAAEVFPYFTFIVVRKEKGGAWQTVETFNGRADAAPAVAELRRSFGKAVGR